MSVTTESQIQSGFSAGAFQAFLDRRNEPDWLATDRRDHWDRFQQMSWPGRRDEEWIRTDIRLFKLDRYSFPDQAMGPAPSSGPAPALADG